jgi:hypothetical protein
MVNEAVYAHGERLRSKGMIQPLRILISASLECQYRTTRPRPRRNEKLITTPFRSSPATAPNLLEVADLFDGVAQGDVNDRWLSGADCLPQCSRRTTEQLDFLLTTPDTRAGIRAQNEGRQLNAEADACSVAHEDLGQSWKAVLHYAYQERSLPPTARGSRCAEATGSEGGHDG